MKCLLDPCIGSHILREPMFYPPYNNWYLLQILLLLYYTYQLLHITYIGYLIVQIFLHGFQSSTLLFLLEISVLYSVTSSRKKIMILKETVSLYKCFKLL